MVTLSTVSNFGGLTFGRSFLDLALFLTRRLEGPRIRQVQRLSPSTLISRVRLTSAAGVDTELQAWIREAYQLSLSGGKRS
jgi:hypothetical protein